jgi:hypothetical protein
MASARPKDAGSPSSSDSRKPIRTYTGWVARMTSHGMSSSHPITIAAPNNSQPPTLSSR